MMNDPLPPERGFADRWVAGQGRRSHGRRVTQDRGYASPGEAASVEEKLDFRLEQAGKAEVAPRLANVSSDNDSNLGWVRTLCLRACSSFVSIRGVVR